MEEGAPANATASLPPSYETVLAFLTTLAQWLKHARERLTCRDEVGRHAIAVEALTRHRERAYEQLTESVWRHTAAAGDMSTSLLPSASVELTAWVLLRLLVLLLTWWLLMRLVRATTLPRLRARQIAVHPHVHLPTSVGSAQVVEAFIHPDAAQRGINATLLLTVSACVSVACLLILCLLAMHVWVDVVLLRLLQHWTAPLWQAQTWLASHVLWPSNSSPQGSLQAPATPVEQYATSFISVVSGLNSSLFHKLAWLRRLTQQVKLMYLWGMVGGTMLGVVLWLLGYSSTLLRTYNASLPYFEENDPLLRWLAQQEAEAAQQRTNAAFAALLESQHRQERVMERLASSLAPATPRERQRYLQMTEEGAGSHCFVEDAALASATSDATEDERRNGETAAGGADAVIINNGCSGDGNAGKLRVASGPSPDSDLAAAFEVAASATRGEGAAEASCGTTPQAEEEGAATTALRMAKEGESPGS
ncbi:conserved hypothetical protein [Leishmania major strain Friedlin]|uniref:Uncharacterized protein n=1 Tax=Leishmania major TaxID=5664 RepID=Q4Q1J1_LEIMA|nr:conserved hypothetical protein [Leishmania major strain Friedlin]CAG9583759.1 hypothetical_protein_-_conserved [Leishmania major strain Friedlin]CAJ09188.1 conserved hypothetical protein [Leishmania major strain Friedlin]|eukprot:XP_001686807.1 conserved hypothetical protein [Leishmania major strain Friedlin]